MDKKERKTLGQIFADPADTFTRWIDVEQLFIGLGGYAKWSDKTHLTVELNGHKESFATPEDKSSRLDEQDGAKVRSFLSSAGITAEMAKG